MAFACQTHPPFLPQSIPKINYHRRENRAKTSTSSSSFNAPNPNPNFEIPSPPSLFKPPNPNPSLSKTLTLALATASVASTSAFSGGFLFNLYGGGGGGGWRGGGGGGGEGFGGGGGGFWSKVSSFFVANAKGNEKEFDSHGLPADLTVPLGRLSSMKKYKISDISFFDRRQRSFIGDDDPLLGVVSLHPDEVCTKSRLQTELQALKSSGMFGNVEIEAKTKPDGTVGLVLSFTEAVFQKPDGFRCVNTGLMPEMKGMEMDPDMTDREKLEYMKNQGRAYKRRIQRSRPCLLPTSVQREVLGMVRGQGKVSTRLLMRIQDRVQRWYHDQGYACARVTNFGNLNLRELLCEVDEGDVTKLDIRFLDKVGHVVEGNTRLGVIQRELPKQLGKGHVFNTEAARQALRNINALGLFSSIEVNPRADERNQDGVVVELKLKEMEQKSAEVTTEWNLVPGRNGWPSLASIQPGGTVTFEHRNIKGLNRSLLGSISSCNFFGPQDDAAFKLDYVHPYLDGVRNPRNRTFRASCFNSRKMSPIFTGGPDADEVPPVWIDRAGIKATITESFTPQSKFTYGLAMEEIKTCDETGTICTHGARQLPSGGLSMDGPPTTLSGTGIDRMAFAQANITRDTTKFVNGAIVGERNVFQVDQGLGIGSKFPFFNRHQLTLTRFIPLKKVEGGDGKPPPTVVLHGHYGGCLGDLPSYDAFTLGGPYSVRGYNMGELGACRNKLELATELRVPVKTKGTYVYAFAEHGNDLGSSKDVKGNPTKIFHRVGHGSSYGIGLKLGSVRVEYDMDHNSGSGALVCRFGERF